MLWVLIAAVPIGILIGVVGIGGLLLPALLGQVTGDQHLAAGTSSWAFLFTGVVATVGLLRDGRLERRTAVPVGCAAAPGAALGAVVAGWLPGDVLVLLLALVCLGSGLQNLLGRGARGERHTLALPGLIAVGFVVGFGSAVTGTGGPVLLVPVLLALGMGVVETVALGLFVQIPIVVFAVAGYAAQGDVAWGWGAAYGVVAAGGVLVGMAIGRRTPPDLLRRVAATVLVLTGVYLAVVTLR